MFARVCYKFHVTGLRLSQWHQYSLGASSATSCHCGFLIFLSDYFAVSKFCYTFVAVNELATTYQHNISMQGILKFFASFCADYLVNPNNLLTHTHTFAPSVQ